MKNYIAYGFNGGARVCFQFESAHRANSKANIDDANNVYKKHHGHRIEIVNTARSEYISGYPEFLG